MEKETLKISLEREIFYFKALGKGNKREKQKQKKRTFTKKSQIIWRKITIQVATHTRDKRDAARTLLANGGDPLGKKKESERSIRAFDSAHEEWFEHRKRERAPSYIKAMRLRANRYLHGKLPDKPFSELEVPDILSIIRETEKRGTFETARKIAQICGQVCRYARLSVVVST